jgi:LysR family transcriptional regulator, glycine cleavage system transcriptional activator
MRRLAQVFSMSLRPELLPALAAFEAAARHQNFAHAAEELHLTASAVSHHVRKLEARLGAALFSRHARGVNLTAEGRRLADAASNALGDIDVVLRALQRHDKAQSLLRINTLHSLLFTWLIPRLPRFSAAHPEVRIHLETETALTRFDEGGADFAIRHGPGHWPGLTAHALMDECLFAVASPKFPGVRKLRSVAQIAALPLIADLARQGWQDWFRAASVHGAKIDERYTFSDSTDALQAAAEGLGVALARERIVTPWLANGSLIALPGPRIPARWTYHIVYPAHRRLRPVAQKFVDWLRNDVVT